MMKIGKTPIRVRLVSFVLTLLIIAAALPLTVLTASAETMTEKTIQLFNSGCTSSAGKNYSSANNNNPAPATLTNKGYDLYGRMPSNSSTTFRAGLSFTVEQEVTELATLTIKAYDVDEEDGEYDEVILVDETGSKRTVVGTLKGKNNEWNTTTLRIDPKNFTKGHSYHFEIRISSKKSGPTWWVYIRTVALKMTVAQTGNTPDTPDTPNTQPTITSHAFSASISDNGVVTATLKLAASEATTYQLEYAASIGNDQTGSLLNQSITATPSGTTKTVTFSLESGSKKGTYRIDVMLTDAKGNTVTTYSADAGYGYNAVSYDANGGSSNIPQDTGSYLEGNTVQVLFNRTPSRNGYTFLGWSTMAGVSAPLFTKDGATITIAPVANGITVTDDWGRSETYTTKENADGSMTFTAPSGHTYCFTFGKLDGTTVTATMQDAAGNTIGLQGSLLSYDLTGTVRLRIAPQFTIGTGDVTLYAVWKKNTCTTHTWGNYTVEKQPGCTTTGSKSATCTACGTKTTVTIPATGHSYGQWTVKQAATCNTPGSKSATCTTCGQTVSATIPTIGHSYTTTVVEQATCTTAGIIRHACSSCGDSYLTYIYSEHSWEKTSYTAPTCTVDGALVYTCSKCGDTYQETIPGEHQYVATVTKKATDTEVGEITYTCASCGHSYTEEIPVRAAANILLVQDRLPWTENANMTLLANLQTQGYIAGWDAVTTAQLATVTLGLYDVIYVANDQTTATYNQLKNFAGAIEEYVKAGGVVIYGACDHGWAGGSITYTLPGGVGKGNYYSWHNYIANPTHAVVTGVLTDGKSLTDKLLYSTYSSHTYFTNLPQDANIILTDANGKPTLVEYALGDGYVIASGLTWEYTFVRNMVNGTSFAKSVYDDLLVWAVSLSTPCNHVYGEGVIVAPTCTEAGYTAYTCTTCGLIHKTDAVAALGHTPGTWQTQTAATTTKAGREILSCTVCGAVMEERDIPAIGGAYATVTGENKVACGEEITFTVTIQGADKARNLGLELLFDETTFTYVSYQFGLNATIRNFDTKKLRAAYAWDTDTDINTTVFRFTLCATAETTLSTVGCRVLLDNGKTELSVVPASVTVTACTHPHVTTRAIDGTNHAAVCDACHATIVSAHSYASACDASCDACGYTRTAPHAYGQNLQYDQAGHRYVCTLCGQTRGEAAHTMTVWYEAKGGHVRTCACGYHEEGAHTMSDWRTDDTMHYASCTVCGALVNEKHVYTDACDASCDTCGYLRTPPHSFDAVWHTDGETHWHACTLCGEKKGEEAHVWEGDTDGCCDTCGYERFIRGDMDGDGDVDSDDAIYLLNSLFYPTLYPLAQPGDVDGDGKQNANDPIHLLRHAIFGAADYPLS